MGKNWRVEKEKDEYEMVNMSEGERKKGIENRREMRRKMKERDGEEMQRIEKCLKMGGRKKRWQKRGRGGDEG